MPSSKSDCAALALLLIGLALIMIGMAMIDSGHFLIRAGSICWVLTYWIVLIENFMSKRPLQTRGGVVKVADGTWRYAIPYAPMLVFGLGLFVAAVFV